MSDERERRALAVQRVEPPGDQRHGNDPEDPGNATPRADRPKALSWKCSSRYRLTNTGTETKLKPIAVNATSVFLYVRICMIRWYVRAERDRGRALGR